MDKKLRNKLIIVSVIVIVLMLAIGAIEILFELPRVRAREQISGQLKLDAVAEVVRTVENQRVASKASYERHLRENVQLMTVSLKTDLTEEGYTGPMLLEDGAVVVLRGEKAVWPEGMPEGFPELTSAEVRSGEFITLEVPSRMIGEDGWSNPDAGPDDITRAVFLGGQIGGDYWYVDCAFEEDMLMEPFSCLKDKEFLKMAEESFGGTLLFVSADDPAVPMRMQTSAWPGVKNAAELGLTQEAIAEKQEVVTVDGKTSLCCYANVDDGAATLIYVKPVHEMFMHAVLHVALIQISCFLVLAALICYMFSVQHYVMTKPLSRVLIKRYQPKSFRRIIIMAGLTGAIAIFVCTSMFQTLDAVHQDSISGAKTISRLFEYLEDTANARMAFDKKEEEEWDSYQAERLANLISERPELGTREKLQEYCDVLAVDYMIIFDAQGKETITNSVYTGLTMDDGLGENSADFKRLLNGVPYIVHEASANPVTGLTHQMIGATIPLTSASGEKTHGALIMAVPPKDMKQMMDEDSRARLRFVNNDVTLCFFSDPESGEILNASDPDMIGKTLREIGLPEKSLQDGYTDFTSIDDKDCYVTKVKQAGVDFFFGISTGFVFGNSLPAAGMGFVFFLLALLIVIPISLSGYTEENFKMWKDTNLKKANAEEIEHEDKKKETFSELLVSSKNYGKLTEKSPEDQASLILKINALLLVVIPTIAFFLNGKGPDKALFNYILYGDWMRGVNLFSLTGILMVATISLLILLVCNILLSLIAGFTGRGGETLCRLLYSLVRYIAILAIIYYIFEYVGLSMSTYIASLGTVSLALSIGSRDMVADIVAGIMILFERQFQVGDYVEIDGCRGQVLEMGVRSTKVLCQGNDIRFISNSGIRSVVNKTKRLSTGSMELTVVTSDTIEQVEELFNRELPAIGKKKRMIKELSLAGISRVSGGGKPDRDKVVSTKIKWSCQEGDQETVRDFITREIYLLCEREGIEIR